MIVLAQPAPTSTIPSWWRPPYAMYAHCTGCDLEAADEPGRGQRPLPPARCQGACGDCPPAWHHLHHPHCRAQGGGLRLLYHFHLHPQCAALISGSKDV